MTTRRYLAAALFLALSALVIVSTFPGAATAQPHERFRLPGVEFGVSAYSFGAVPNDGADDSDAINAAQVYASTNDKGPVLLEGGRYNISKTLVLYPNAGLVGVGEETELFLAANAAATLTNITTNLVAPIDYLPIVIPLTTGGPHAGIVISDLTINGNGANQDEGWSYTNISTRNSTGMLIARVRSIDAAQGLVIVNTVISSGTWDQASLTITDGAGTFAGARVGQRLRFTSGGASGLVDTSTTFTVTATNQNTTCTVNADINGGVQGNDSNINATFFSCRAFCMMFHGEVSPLTLSANATWTNATSTLNDTGNLTNVNVGDRVRFSAGEATTRLAQDFFVVSVSGDDSAVLHADANPTGGDVPAGTLAGIVYRDSVGTAGISAYAKASGCVFDNAGYDCVTVRGIGARFSTIEQCTIGRGQQTSFQIADRGPDTTISNCTIDNTATADGAVGAGIICHAARRAHIDNCTVICDNQSNAISIFGDNNPSYTEAAPNLSEDVHVTGGIFKYIGDDASTVGFSNTPEYMRRIRFSGTFIEALAGDSTSGGAAIAIADEVNGGLEFDDCYIRSNSNTSTVSATYTSGNPAKNVAFNGGVIENFGTSASFANFRCLIIQGDAGATPDQMAFAFSGVKFLWNDPDAIGVRLLGGAGATFNGCVFMPTGSTAHTAQMLSIDNFDDVIVNGCLFQGHVSTAAPVIYLLNDPRSVVITNNIFQTGIDNTTAPAYGIGVSTGSTYILIANNDGRTLSSSLWFTTFGPSTGSVVRNNRSAVAGDPTENKLTGALAAGAATFNHAIKAWRTLTPGDVVAQSNGSPITCTAVSATQITLAGTGTDTYYVTIRANEY